VKIAYHFTRRSIAKLTGRETDRMIEPLQPRARHRPGRLQRRHGVAIPVAHPWPTLGERHGCQHLP